MSETPLGDALKKPPEIPQNEVQIGAATENGDVGVRGRGHVDLGEAGGWWVAGTLEYWKQKGAEAAVWLGWSKQK